MNIVCISDTHERHAGLTIPDGDVIVHAGDLTLSGDVEAIVDGFAWLSEMPHRNIIFVPGNHDFGFQDIPGLRSELAQRFPRVTVLMDESTVIGGLRVYGSPYQPWFHDWAFNFAPGDEGLVDAQARWAKIPDATQILITHGPVRGILDRVRNGERAGCPQLRARIAELDDLRLHVCGHIHEAYGTEEHGRVLYVNASTCDVHYRPVQAPIVVDLD